MKRINTTPQDKRIFTCPQCLKHRMSRSLDHIVSKEEREYKTRDGNPISLIVDICDFCRAKNSRRFFEPTKSDIRKVLKAMQEEANLTDDKSLEDLL